MSIKAAAVGLLSLGPQTKACEAPPVSNNENTKAVVLTQPCAKVPLLGPRHKSHSLCPWDKPWGLC